MPIRVCLSLNIDLSSDHAVLKFNSKGLDMQQAAFAVKKYHSHHRVELAIKNLTALDAETASRRLL
jgi:hypothetical protein